MDPLVLCVRLSAHLSAAARGLSSRRDERGDVPGWVLITVMTIALGAGLFAIAEPALRSMLRSALNSVQ